MLGSLFASRTRRENTERKGGAVGRKRMARELPWDVGQKHARKKTCEGGSDKRCAVNAALHIALSGAAPRALGLLVALCAVCCVGVGGWRCCVALGWLCGCQILTCSTGGAPGGGAPAPSTIYTYTNMNTNNKKMDFCFIIMIRA